MEPADRSAESLFVAPLQPPPRSTTTPYHTADISGWAAASESTIVISLSPEGRGWGEGVRKLQSQTPSSEPPHPVLLPRSASKTRVTALMGEKGRSVHVATSARSAGYLNATAQSDVKDVTGESVWPEAGSAHEHGEETGFDRRRLRSLHRRRLRRRHPQ